MKNTFLTLLFLLCVGGVTAQKTDRPQNESAPQEETFDQMPAFPGDLNHYMINELHYPAIALKENIEGRVLLRFVVRSSGEVDDVTVVRSVHPALDEEAIRVVSNMPRWQPAMRNHMPVSSHFTLPVWFKLKT
jgi:protein TonB